MKNGLARMFDYKVVDKLQSEKTRGLSLDIQSAKIDALNKHLDILNQKRLFQQKIFELDLAQLDPAKNRELEEIVHSKLPMASPF